MKVIFNPLSNQFEMVTDTKEIRAVVMDVLRDVPLGGGGGGLQDAPSNGSLYGRQDGVWTVVPEGVTDHALLSNLDYASAAHTGFQETLTFPLAANLGGTGIANGAGSTLTLGGATTITGGGILALGGFTLTVPATGTAALLATANVFTAIQKINVNSTTALLVEQDGVKDNVLVVDTTNGRVGIGIATPAYRLVVAENGASSIVSNSSASNTDAHRTIFLFQRALGTHESPLSVGNSTWLGSFQANGYHTGAGGMSAAAGIDFYVDGGIASSRLRGHIRFSCGNPSGVFAEMMRINSSGNVGIGTVPATRLHVAENTATTNAVIEVGRLEARVSTTSTGGAAGFGVGQSFYAETATDGTYQQQGLISTSWVDSTNATRKAKMSLSAYDTAARLGIEIEADGSAAKLGFYGVATVIRPTALTTQLTTITHTVPTPDYAIQDFVDVSLGAGWAFASHDEANTTLSVIANLQTRVGELETKLQALGLLT
jgi:hypothetical protein